MGKFFSDKTELAIDLLYGTTKRENFQRGFALLVEAAEQEQDADALYFLSRCYMGEQYIWKYSGFGQDIEKSDEILLKSIEFGSACGVLGAMRRGLMDTQLEATMPFSSLKEARDIVLAKAEAGHPFCQFMIGNTYFWGDVVDIDGVPLSEDFSIRVIPQAIAWYERVTESGYLWCSGNLLNIYQSGRYGYKAQPDKYTALVDKLADLGNPEMVLRKGDRYYDQNDYERALVEYKRAIDMGHLGAWYDVGWLYTYGQGVEKDQNYAFLCYEKAAKAGHDKAKTMVGRCHYYGRGTPENNEEAFYWLDLAAKEEETGAYETLGLLFLRGDGVAKNYEAARNLLENAKQTKDVLSGLASIYLQGYGVPQDIARGVTLLQQAADKGDDWAKKQLTHYKKGLFGGWKRIN